MKAYLLQRITSPVLFIALLALASTIQVTFASKISTQNLSSSKPLKRALTFQDIMQFRSIQNFTISESGKLVALSAVPDRGDSEGLVFDIAKPKSAIASIDRGSYPVITANGSHVLFKQSMSLIDHENLSKKEKKQWLPSYVVINTENGTQTQYTELKDAQLAANNNWLGLLERYTQEETQETTNDMQESADKEPEENTHQGEAVKKVKSSPNDSKTKMSTIKDKLIGGTLTLKSLVTDHELVIEYVTKFRFSQSGDFLAFATSSPEGAHNQVKVIDLNRLRKLSENTLHSHQLSNKIIRSLVSPSSIHIGLLDWHPTQNKLIFSLSNIQTKEEQQQFELYKWSPRKNNAEQIVWKHPNRILKSTAQLTWSKKESYVYVGLNVGQPKPIWPSNNEKDSQEDSKKNETEGLSAAKLLDPSTIAQKAEMTLWHLNDPMIKTYEKKQYEQAKTKPIWFAHDWSGRGLVAVSHSESVNISINQHNRFQIATDITPYARKILYDGFYVDVYRVDSKTGKRKLIAKENSSYSYQLSPNGRFAIYFENGHYKLRDFRKNTVRNTTKDLIVSFEDELHDYPSTPSPYPIIGWSNDSKFVYIRDRFDIWQIKATNGSIKSITKGKGRELGQTFDRIVTEYDTPYIDSSRHQWMVNAYSNRTKANTIYRLDTKTGVLTPALNANKRYTPISVAKKGNKIFFTTEDYNQFPDIWHADTQFKSIEQLTETNPQAKQFLWSQAPELISWTSTKGKPLQGVLLKPANYKPGKKVPVIVYFYRYMTQRMHQFNPMKLNHRPNFNFYTSNGYAIFLPDVIFDIGTPGASATQALVPGVQKLIDLGIANPDAIGLQGHSWAGYQSAFLITQTDIFKAVVSGAPVSNMTSAYSGIRLKSGLARQFQYETGQSRIGQSLNQARELYIENSPVFFADRINTPLLMMFGDIDGAVPWQQGIEMYLAMRREEKDVALLQYHNEGHHLKKYANKLDYSQKMLEYFDYHLKGKEPASWITNGIKYSEKD